MEGGFYGHPSWRRLMAESFAGGVARIRQGILLLVVSDFFVVAGALAALYYRSHLLLIIVKILNAIVSLAGVSLVYAGFSAAAEASERYEVGKWGAVLWLVAALLGLIPYLTGLSGLLSLVGFILVLLGVHKLGDLDVSDEVQTGVVYVAVGLVLSVILIGFVLVLWGTVKIIRGLRMVEQRILAEAETGGP